MALALLLLVSYLIGTFPTGVVVSRALAGRDPRDHGSGHTGGLNVYRTVGLVGLLLTGVGDIGKGALAVWLASRLNPSPWAIPLAGMAVIAGHCWPFYLGFRGGMGIGTFGGTLLVTSPLMIPLLVILWGLVYLVLRHTPRATMGTALLAPLLVWAVQGPWPLVLAAALVIFVRHIPDRNRNRLAKALPPEEGQRPP